MQSSQQKLNEAIDVIKSALPNAFDKSEEIAFTGILEEDLIVELMAISDCVDNYDANAEEFVEQLLLKVEQIDVREERKKIRCYLSPNDFESAANLLVQILKNTNASTADND